MSVTFIAIGTMTNGGRDRDMLGAPTTDHPADFGSVIAVGARQPPTDWGQLGLSGPGLEGRPIARLVLLALPTFSVAGVRNRGAMVFVSQGCKPLVVESNEYQERRSRGSVCHGYRVRAVFHRHQRSNAIAPRFRIRGEDEYQGFAPLASQCHGSAVAGPAA